MRSLSYLLLLVFFISSCTKSNTEGNCNCFEELDPGDGGGGGGGTGGDPPVSNTQNLLFRGIRADDPNGRDPLENPERGFRFEFIIKAGDLTNPYHGVNYSGDFTPYIMGEENNFGNNKIKVAQVYFYLTDYLQGNISSAAFANMQFIFDELRRAGIKVLLRFAYRYNDASPYETLSDVLGHLAQLKSFMAENEENIYAVQAGFLGLWGEWHTSRYDNSTGVKGRIIRGLMENIPANKRLQVREADHKSAAIPAWTGYIDYNANGNYVLTGYPQLSAAQSGRIGYHNDYFVLDQGPNAGWDYKWPDNDFYQVKNEGGYTTVDGEMPYDGQWEGTFNSIAYGSEGGWYAARRMRAHSYTSFSIVHNYNVNIAAWKTHLLYPYQFRNDNTLVTDDYFLNANGQETGRYAFEYVRDHLGYRLQLRTGTIPSKSAIGGNARVQFSIKNFGFSRMINSRPVYIVLIDQNNVVREYQTTLNAQDIYPTFGQNDGVYNVTRDIPIDNSFVPGVYRVGIWMPDASSELRYDPSFAVRLANGNMQWWTDPANKYLVNTLGFFLIE